MPADGLTKALPKSSRMDFVDDTKLPPRGRLPDAVQGSDTSVTSSAAWDSPTRRSSRSRGAHKFGRSHADRSGFDGPLVNNPICFSNQYFKLLINLEWKPRTFSNSMFQYSYVDPDPLEDEKEEPLMMLPTDVALLSDTSFAPWVQQYAQDKDLFFDHFSKAFAKLIELGIQRDASGNTDNRLGRYLSAPKESDTPTGPERARL
jgi:peroxiredoxin